MLCIPFTKVCDERTRGVSKPTEQLRVSLSPSPSTSSSSSLSYTRSLYTRIYAERKTCADKGGTHSVDPVAGVTAILYIDFCIRKPGKGRHHFVTGVLYFIPTLNCFFFYFFIYLTFISSFFYSLQPVHCIYII